MNGTFNIESEPGVRGYLMNGRRACMLIGLLTIGVVPAYSAVVIKGTSAADTIDVSGLSEEHEIYGLGGADVITGSMAPDRIDGGGRDDRIDGAGGDDWIRGGSGNDVLLGGTGADAITGSNGNDSISGGEGIDTAIFSGERSQYVISPLASAVSIRDTVGKDGTDTLISIEILEFADGFLEDGAFRSRYPDNRPPAAEDDFAAVAEDGNVLIEVLANDTDADGDLLRVLELGTPEHGNVSQGPDGSIMYVPMPDWFGEDKFTYVVDDGRFGRTLATVTIEILPQPDAPVAHDDGAIVPADETVVVDVLGNDSDADGDALHLYAVGAAGYGIAQAFGNSVKYTPVAGFKGEDSFDYTVSDGTGRLAVATVRVNVGLDASGDGLLQLLMNAPEGSWVKINLNEFSDVWTPLEQRPPLGYNNPAKLLFAWSSMAWASNRNQLIFWGGGHANYAGNEVYRFDVRTRLWQRASLPSAIHNPLGDKQFFAIDGPDSAPTAAHTYDNQEFLPLADRFITFGGAKFNCCIQWVLLDGVTPTGPYLWDPSRSGEDMVGGTTGSQVYPAQFPDVIGAQMWDNRDTVVNRGIGATRPAKFVNGTTAYMPYGGHDAVYVSESPTTGGRLFQYIVRDPDDPRQDEWRLIGVKGRAGYSDQGAGAFCPSCNLFVRTANSGGSNVLAAWDVSKAGPQNSHVNIYPADTTGEFRLTRDHGMDFDSQREVFALWDGGPDVWYIHPAAITEPSSWRVARGPVREDMPTPLKSDGNLTQGSRTKESNGILGKWKYAPRYDVFLGVENAVTGDIWAYKPAGWSPKL
jgi:Ca2+-binding RTX toxin-like protein